MKKLKALAAVAMLGSAASLSSAALLVADGFDYTVGALSGKADADYTPNPATWAFAGVAGQAGPTVVTGNTVYTGPGALPSLPGSNSAQFNTVDGSSTRIQLATPATSGVYSQTANAGTSLFYSFTMSASDISKLSTGTGGSFVAGFNNSVGAGTAPTAIVAALSMNRDSSTAKTFHLGIAQQQALGRTFSSNEYALNDPLFVVVAYNFGTTAGTDTADLYVFDSANNDAIPAALPSTPTAHGAYTAEINTSVDSISSFLFRDNTGAMTASADDLRIGTTWADVATVPEPASLSLLALGALGALARRGRRTA